MLPNDWTEYFDAIEQKLNGLPSIQVEQFDAVILTSTRANLKLRIRFRRKCLLAISEILLLNDKHISKIDYRYHFQDENNRLIFRYDCTPHFPSVASFPHHKHLPDDVIATKQPNIFEIFQEASDLLNPED